MKTLTKYADLTKTPLGVFKYMKGFSNAACIYMSGVFLNMLVLAIFVILFPADLGHP
jgi:hypothetical protein